MQLELSSRTGCPQLPTPEKTCPVRQKQAAVPLSHRATQLQEVPDQGSALFLWYRGLLELEKSQPRRSGIHDSAPSLLGLA